MLNLSGILIFVGNLPFSRLFCQQIYFPIQDKSNKELTAYLLKGRLYSTKNFRTDQGTLMKTNLLLRNVLVSMLLLTSSYSVYAQNYSSQNNMAQLNVSQMTTSGEIIGDFNSPDGAVVGATLPGKSVAFKIPVENNKAQYLHFAFMHAASAQNGWYFAPKSEYGIHLMAMKNGQSKDITHEIGLFQAPNAQIASPVKTNINELKAGKAANFMMATITKKNSNYIVNIKNISSKDYETPFSSGVWSTTNQKMKDFDHKPSSALSTLATSGDRGLLYQIVKRR